MFARKKINMTSRSVNRACTLPPKPSSVKKKFGTGSIFCVFRIQSQHFDSFWDKSEPPNFEADDCEKRIRNFRNQCARAFTFHLLARALTVEGTVISRLPSQFCQITILQIRSFWSDGAACHTRPALSRINGVYGAKRLNLSLSPDCRWEISAFIVVFACSTWIIGRKLDERVGYLCPFDFLQGESLLLPITR